MIDEDLADVVLRMAQEKPGITLAEVRLEETSSRQVAVKASEVSNVTSLVDAGMNVRIVTPTGVGFASSNKVAKQEGAELVQNAYRLARTAKTKMPVAFSEEHPVRTNWIVSQKKKLADTSIDEKVGYLREIDSSVMKTKIKVQGRYYELKDYEISSFFVNSEGSRISSFLPRVSLESQNLVSHKGETEQSVREFGATGGWEVVAGWDLPKALAAEIVMLKTQIEKGRRVKPGTMDLVCGPEVAGIAAHESCGHPMEGDRILGREMSQAGRSFVTPDMIGKKIGSRYATVIDDPAIPGSYGFYAYDQEGVKARARYLYKEGIINDFLHNRETAAKLGVLSNGSSRSQYYLREPIVRMANTYVAPGDFEDDELIGAVKTGVIMHSFTEWNIDDKRYNQKYVSREAYFIRDGELAGPARKVVLEITTPGFWSAIDAVSKNVKFSAAECGKGDPAQGMAVFTGGPLLRLRGVTLR